MLAKTFLVAEKLLPLTAIRLAGTLLSTPASSARSGRLPDEYRRTTLRTTRGKLVLRSIGDGPVVLFSHGWSGNSAQFRSLMNQVADAGYRAVALDHYRHGESTGTESNFLLFIRALESVQQYLQKAQTPVRAVVGHSAGGISSLHVFDARKIPHLLISPVIGVHERTRDCAVNAGFSESLFQAAVARIEADSGICFDHIDEAKVLQDPDMQVHLLHSRKDRLVSPQHSANFQVRAPHLGLTITDTGGHTSILNNLSTSAVMLSWLAPQKLKGESTSRQSMQITKTGTPFQFRKHHSAPSIETGITIEFDKAS